MQIRLFGQFRNYFKQAEISVPVEPSDTLDTLKKKLSEIPLGTVTQDALRSLLDHSVFATESRVLLANEGIPTDAKLALLPPVCGG